MSKNSVFLWLALALFAVQQISAETYSGSCGENVNWTLDTETGEMVISGTGPMTDYQDGSAVPWYNYRTLLRKLVINEGVTSIGNFAFRSCGHLASVAFPEGLTGIGRYVFCGCGNLTNITFPEGLVSIGQDAFSGCNNLTNITFPEGLVSIGSWAFCGCGNLTNITFPEGLVSIGQDAFSSCENLTNITFPEGLVSIGDGAFENCTAITSIRLPEGMTNIGSSAFKYTGWYNAQAEGFLYLSDYLLGYKGTKPSGDIAIAEGTRGIVGGAFAGCDGITSVSIPISVKSVGEVAFHYCTSLTSVDLSACTSIGERAFNNCSSLTSVGNLSACTSIGDYAFNECSSLTSVGDLSACTSIGSYAFYNCSSLTSVGNLSACTSIGDYAFNECSSLTSVGDLSACTSIGSYAFYNCSSLTSVGDLSACTSIGSYAFYYCSSLTSVGDLSACTSIGNYAFYGGVSLTSLTFGSKVPAQLGNSALKTHFTLLVPEASLSAYLAAEGWSNYASQIIPHNDALNKPTIESTANPGASDLISQIGEANLPYVTELTVTGTINGYDIMAMRNKMTNLHVLDLSGVQMVANDNGYQYYSGQSLQGDNQLGNNAFDNPLCKLTDVKLPSGLTYIGNCAFRGNDYLQHITIPANVTYLGSEALRVCGNLQEIVIPDYVTSIRFYTFSGCGKLKTVTLGKGLTEIEYNAFEKCYALTSVSFPVGLKRIDSYSFWNCTSLKEVRIPSSVNAIADNAFCNCNALTKVYAYVIEPQSIGQNTFTSSAFLNATLYTPSTSHELYYYNTQWSQFQNREDFDEPYEYFFLENDYTLNDETNGRIEGDPDAELNNHSGLIVEGDEEQGLGDIEVNHDGTDGPSIIGEGDNIKAESLTVKVQLNGRSWKFFCFPFNIAYSNITLVPDNSKFAGEFVMYTYDGAQRATGSTGWVRVDPSETLTAGKGYIIQGSTNGTLQITVEGAALDFSATDKLEEMVAHTAADEADASWNFLGNPYLSYYDLDALSEQFGSPITVWDGSQYLTYRPGDDNYQLHPFEAFFVQKPEGLPKIEFKGNNRITYNGAQNAKAAHARRMRQAEGDERTRFLINLTLTDGTTTDRTRVVFNEQAAMGYERTCDAAKFDRLTAIPQLWTLGGQTRYAINERPAGEGIVALGYEAIEEGTLTISAERMDKEVVLIDHATGTVHDFRKGDYTFLTEVGTFVDRFSLSLSGTTAIESLDGTTAPREYYTTGGQRAADGEAQGVVIVKQGDKAVKTVSK